MADNISLTANAGNAAYIPDGTVMKTTQAGDSSHVQHIILSDATDTVEIQTGANTSAKGLRVFIGPTDPVSDIPVMIDYEHHQRHEGETHRFQYIDEALNLTTVKFGLVVPSGYSPTIYAPHMFIHMYVYNGSAQVNVYEGATYTGGSAMTAYNVNRNSSTAPAMTGASGVTSTNGTLLPFSFYAGAGNRGGGETRGSSEFIMKVNTTYRVDLIGLVNGTDAILQFEWYEDLGV